MLFNNIKTILLFLELKAATKYLLLLHSLKTKPYISKNNIKNVQNQYLDAHYIRQVEKFLIKKPM